MKNKLVDNTLEIFSANWVCNINKESFVKLGKQDLKLDRGFNSICIKNKQLTNIKNFDTCADDLSIQIQRYIKDLYDKKEYDYLILITHDNASKNINPSILQDYLSFIGCKELYRFKGSYSLIYDLKNNKIISEICDNDFPIHEWFEITENKLENLGIPVYLIVYELLYFVKKSVEQLKKFTKNIHIIDNNSKYPKLLEYYDKEYEFFIDRMDNNYGHRVWYEKIYGNFPRIFAISDPDLEFNEKLPINFLEIMKELSNEYKKAKVGWALDISDAELFYKWNSYNTYQSIQEIEKRYWIRKVHNPKYELYNANVDTTFCIVNKGYLHEFDAIRIAGDFTCKHIPWYEGWHKKLDIEEWEYYKKNNISSTIIKHIQNRYNVNHEDNINLYNGLDQLIYNIDEYENVIDRSKYLSDKDRDEMKNDLIGCIECINKNKVKMSKMINDNLDDIYLYIK